MAFYEEKNVPIGHWLEVKWICKKDTCLKYPLKR